MQDTAVQASGRPGTRSRFSHKTSTRVTTSYASQSAQPFQFWRANNSQTYTDIDMRTATWNCLFIPAELLIHSCTPAYWMVELKKHQQWAKFLLQHPSVNATPSRPMADCHSRYFLGFNLTTPTQTAVQILPGQSE